MKSETPDRGPHVLAYLHRTMDGLERLLGAVAGLTLAGFVGVVLIDVIFREALAKPLFAPSEISVCLFIWSTMLAAAVAARRQAHFVIDFLPENLPPRLNKILETIAALATIVFAGVLLWYGLGMAERGIGRFSPMSGFPMVIFFSAFPAAGFAFLLFAIEHLLGTLLKDTSEQL